MRPPGTVFIRSPQGWRGWALFALAAVPVLVLTFFFLAVMLALFAVVALIAIARLAWHRYRFRGPSSAHDPRPQGDPNTFTVAVRDITDVAPASPDENRPAPRQLPASSSRD